MGIPYGAPDDPQTLLAANNLPRTHSFRLFHRRVQLPYVAMAPCRWKRPCRTEGNIYSPGRFATNGNSRACSDHLDAMNEILGPDEVREKLR